MGRELLNDCLRNEIFNKYNNVCGNCGNKGKHIHHIVPIALGGTNNINNLVLLCEKCHSLIHDAKLLSIKDLNKKTFEKYKNGNKKTRSGKWWGNQPIELPENSDYIYEQYNNKVITRKEAETILGIKTTTFYKYNPYKK